jgi:hypothetical protein
MTDNKRYFELYRNGKYIFASLTFSELFDEMVKDNIRTGGKCSYSFQVVPVHSLVPPPRQKTYLLLYRNGLLMGQYSTPEAVSNAIDKDYIHSGHGVKYTVKAVKEGAVYD